MRGLNRGRLWSRRNGKGDGVSDARHGRELDGNEALRGTDVVALLLRLQIKLVLLMVGLVGLHARVRELVQGRVVVVDGREARVRTVVGIGELMLALIIDLSGACRMDRILIDARGGRQSSRRNVAAAANMSDEAFGGKRYVADGRSPLCRQCSDLATSGRAVHGLHLRGLGAGRAKRSFEGERSDDGRIRRAACQIGRRRFDRCDRFLVEAAENRIRSVRIQTVLLLRRATRGGIAGLGPFDRVLLSEQKYVRTRSKGYIQMPAERGSTEERARG